MQAVAFLLGQSLNWPALCCGCVLRILRWGQVRLFRLDLEYGTRFLVLARLFWLREAHKLRGQTAWIFWMVPLLVKLFSWNVSPHSQPHRDTPIQLWTIKGFRIQNTQTSDVQQASTAHKLAIKTSPRHQTTHFSKNSRITSFEHNLGRHHH